MLSDAERIVYSDGPATETEAMITLYGVDGRRVGEFPVRKMLENRNVTIVRNKAGVAKRAQMKALTCHIRPVLSSTGQVFEQHLASGVVYALKGVRGSERT